MPLRGIGIFDRARPVRGDRGLAPLRSPRLAAGYVGLVPSEHTSGQTRRLGLARAAALNARGNLLRNGRGKPAGVVTIPIARVLVGACWKVATA